MQKGHGIVSNNVVVLLGLLHVINATFVSNKDSLHGLFPRSTVRHKTMAQHVAIQLNTHHHLLTLHRTPNGQHHLQPLL